MLGTDRSMRVLGTIPGSRIVLSLMGVITCADWFFAPAIVNEQT